MRQKFVTTNLHIDNVHRTVSVEFSYDVDEDTIDSRSLFVTKENDLNLIKCKYKVDGCVVSIIFDEDFEVNEVYSLYATHKILSVTGEKLAMEITRTFSIDSNVDSVCKIISPANHEDIKTLRFEWTETEGKSKKLANAFYLQVAPDVHFFRPILQTEISGQTYLEVKKIDQARQYFVRVRSQIAPDDYGNWSETVTFTYAPPACQEDDDDDIIFVKKLELIARPEDGITPAESFIFEFDKELDPASLEDNIRVYRKDW